MIPPVLIRQIRSCDECVFFNMVEEFCTLHEDALYREKIERWEAEDPSLPCPYHFTADEIMELIEQEPCKPDMNGKPKKIWVAQ